MYILFISCLGHLYSRRLVGAGGKNNWGSQHSAFNIERVYLLVFSRTLHRQPHHYLASPPTTHSSSVLPSSENKLLVLYGVRKGQSLSGIDFERSRDLAALPTVFC